MPSSIANCKSAQRTSTRLTRSCAIPTIVRHVFGDATGNLIADTIVRQLRTTTEGLTKTEISAIFGRNQSVAALDAALATLITDGRVRYETTPTAGRSAVRYFAALTH
jgi:hypothetical protein